jgi:hypothetical protein
MIGDRVTIADWVQVLSLLLVAGALALTYLQLREVARQTRLGTAATELGATRDYVDSSWLSRAEFFLSKPDLLNWHLEMRGVRQETEAADRRVMYVLAKMDAHESNFMSFKQSVLRRESWLAWNEVLKDDFRFVEYHETWEKTKVFYAQEFIDYLDREIVPPALGSVIRIPLDVTSPSPRPAAPTGQDAADETATE